MREKQTIKSQITIYCKDGTTRVINSVGVYNTATATDLGKDLEGTNFKSVVVTIL